MTNILSMMVGTIGLALAAVYLLTRMRQLQLGPFRADYVLLHASLGGASAYVGWMLLSGAERLTLLHVCVLVAAACHVLLGQQRGQAWHPREFARSHPFGTEHAGID